MEQKNDKYYTDFIINTNFLTQTTKNAYIKKISNITTIIWPDTTITKILENPSIFEEKLNAYADNTKGRTGQTLGAHTRDAYISAIMALFTYNQELKEKYTELYKQWSEVQKNIRQPIDHKYKSNEPTERQKLAYIPFDEVIKIRDTLKEGSLERLLLMMYSEIPPVRSDYYLTEIFQEMPDKLDKNENCIILTKKNPVLVLEKYKTSKQYGLIIVNIPPKLQKEIELSLELIPRKFLFVSPLTYQPFNKEGTFNQWANRTLKRVFALKNFSLSMLRHIYISRRDLKLEEKSGLEQEQIAKLMGHSVEQQRKYLWHTWLKKIEV